MNPHFYQLLTMQNSWRTGWTFIVAAWCLSATGVECAETAIKTTVASSDSSIPLVRDVLEIKDEKCNCGAKFGEQDQDNLYLYYEESEPGKSDAKRTLQVLFPKTEWRKMKDIFIRYYDFVLLEEIAPERVIKDKSLGKANEASSKYTSRSAMQWDGLNASANFERDEEGKLVKEHGQSRTIGKITMSKKEIAMFYNLLCLGDCLKATRGK